MNWYLSIKKPEANVAARGLGYLSVMIGHSLLFSYLLLKYASFYLVILTQQPEPSSVAHVSLEETEDSTLLFPETENADSIFAWFAAVTKGAATTTQATKEYR